LFLVRGAFGARPRIALVPEPCDSVLFHARVFSGVLVRESEDALIRHREARGRPMQTRLGRTALHGALPTSALGPWTRDGVFFRLEPGVPLASDAPVASSGLVSMGRPFGRRIHAVARRPPRPVPRGPRERRAHSRSGVSSIGSHCAHFARAEARTKPRCVHRSHRRSRDEDRRASMNRPPFATGWLARLRARDLPWSGSRSRASHAVQAFDPTGSDHALL
jgi:hypothetical protein